MLSISYRLFLLAVLCWVSTATAAPQNPIVFVTQIPQPNYFATIGATFANHQGFVGSAPRGGDLYIRYPDGTLKNLTRQAGFGNEGFQGTRSIAVRDPVVSWDGTRVLFSMIIGSPAQYEAEPQRWQLYEIRNLLRNDTPVVSKVSHQPEYYNNVMPAYASDDSIIFVSDRPYTGNGLLYPQLDEYEGTPSNSGIWRLSPITGQLQVLDAAPSGDFHPIVDSFGRIVFSRWDHLQQDQLADTRKYGAFNFSSESSSAVPLESTEEVFPEPRSANRRLSSVINLHNINLFMPWQLNQDGTGHETLNHLGRHDLTSFFTRSFNDDPNLQDFDGRSRRGLNAHSIQNLFHIQEDPVNHGTYYAVNAPEFRTQSAGQLVRFQAPPDRSAEDIAIEQLTHPDTANTLSGSPPTDSGLYRNPLPLTNGDILAVHTAETRDDQNEGTRERPASRYRLRIKPLERRGTYFVAGAPLTPGITKNVSYYDPDVLVTYSGELWELQPVEVVARPRPPFHQSDLPEVERRIFSEEQVELDTFQHELKLRGLALIVSRNVTTRDHGDEQQPYNLRVPGTATASISSPGKIYDVTALQIFQGQQVRSYREFNKGRRFLALPLDNPGIPPLMRPTDSRGATGIFADGSVAAVVPAKKPLTWQLLSPDGRPIVRERVWVTFAPGEVRVCTSCHGLSKIDQLDRDAPQNPPEALRAVLRAWKEGAFGPIVPVDDNGFGLGPTDDLNSLLKPRYEASLRGSLPPRRRGGQKLSRRWYPGARGYLMVKGLNLNTAFKRLGITFRVAGKDCPSGVKYIETDEAGRRTLLTRIPRSLSSLRIEAHLSYLGEPTASAVARIFAPESAARFRNASRAKLCQALARLR